MVNKDRPTIAIMATAINFWYTSSLIKGLRSRADEREVNLRLFTGNSINVPIQAKRERNYIYSLINERNADGIVLITGSLCHYLQEPGEFYRYFSRFSPLPIVGIGDFPEGFPSVKGDNTKGMRELMDHLILDHGYRNIAFISGPMSNNEAVCRLSVYKEALRDNDIEINPDNIVYGKFRWDDGKELIGRLLDERKLKPEVIVCANDEMAFGAYYELNERNISIPDDIALTGYDDVQEARYALPPFTTVKQTFFEQGRAALDMVLEIIETGCCKYPARKVLLPTELIIRKSCGCGRIGGAPESTWISEKRPVFKMRKEGGENLDRLPVEKLGKRYKLCGQQMKKNIRLLYQKLTAAVKGQGSGVFYEIIKKLIYHERIIENDISTWHTIIDILSSHINDIAGDTVLLDRLNVITQGAEALLEESRISLAGRNRVQSDIKALTIHSVIEEISSCLTLEDLLETIQSSFKMAGFDSFYLAFYPGGKFGYPASDLPIDKVRLIFGFDGKETVRYPGDSLYPIHDLVPDRDFKYKHNNHFIIYPITVNGFYFGILVVEYLEDTKPMYEALTSRLCTALGTIKQFSEIENIVFKRTKELEEANEKLKELDIAKTNFIANISHELRTPLTLILGPQESLLAGDYGKEILADPTLRKVFTAMHTNSVRLLRLINNLLDFSKIEAGKMQINRKRTNLNKLLEFYVNSVYPGFQSKGLSIQFTGLTKNIYISLDPDLFEKAFFNLISNAMKFSHKGGTIGIELKQTEKDVQVLVSDCGIGIPPEKLGVIFERFTQVEQSASRKFEGTGIGLAFTKEIVELHKGTISVESTPGKGSIFTISLPFVYGQGEDAAEADREEQDRQVSTDINNEPGVKEEDFDRVYNWLTAEFSEDESLVVESPASPLENNTANVPEKPEYILVVDDNSTMRNFIAGLLEKKYTVRMARHGKDALGIIENGLPDLVISDVMMPEMDGMELCRILKGKKETAMIPIILLSARVDIAARIEGLEGRADDYLVKPFNSRELFARIQNLLEKRRLELHLKKTTDALWSEMETAKQIQSSLLPDKAVIPGFDIACYIQSASEVSGDYYDIIFSGGRYWIVIGDVSGHGVTAGLVMMMVQTALYSLLYKNPGCTPAGLLEDLNSIIKHNIGKLGQEKYMTISVLRLVEKGTFLFSGLHQDIFIYRAATGTIDILETKGMWIGFIDHISALLEDETFTLEQGDTLLLYTDGITEAVRKEWKTGQPGKRFGDTRLQKILKKFGPKKPEEIKAALQIELENYICTDDFTFVIVQKT